MPQPQHLSKVTRPIIPEENPMPESTTTEPVAIGTAIQAFGVAVMAVLTGAEVVDPALGAGLLGVLAAGTVLIGVIVRKKVTPV